MTGDVTALPACALHDALVRGQTSSLEVTRAFLSRIERLDGRLHAVLRVDPTAEAQARACDERLRAGRAGPLEGVPVLVKDNILTRDLETTCGSRILKGFRPVTDATVVRRLREAGAVLLGKANLDEFAMGSSTENSAYGPTRNPWDLERVPGGSSGGSAAAVAARLAPLSLGSETGGSVRQPAAFCGVVGLKPTYGRVSRLGLVAFASSLDQVGPIARTVRDTARLLRVIAGPDPADATSAPAPVDDYEAALDGELSGFRIGIPREFLAAADAEIVAAVRRVADLLEARGTRVEEVSLPHADYVIPVYYLVATAEASSNLARYDGTRYGLRVDPGEGLRAMYRATRGRGFGAEVKRRIMLGTYALSAGYYEAYYGRAMRVRTLIRRDYLECFEAGFHALLGPTTPAPAFRLGEKTHDPLAMYLSDVFTAGVNLAGLPAVSVPAGLHASGLPLGAQFIGPDLSEGRLLRLAAAVEEAIGPFPTPPEWDGSAGKPS